MLIVASAAHGDAEARDKPRPEFEPDVSASGAPPYENSTWILRSPHFVASLERLDDQQRWEFLQQRTKASADPFIASHDSPSGFVTFLLKIESRAEGSLVLHPERCRLITNLKEFRHPLDVATIETSFALLERDVPPAYRAVGPALLDGVVILAPGQKASGLLVYRGFKPGTRSFVVEILVTNPQGEVEEFQAPYRRVKKGRKP
jgi:hypothetical protein